ncbi:MAG: TolB family protein, partial [Anaerolineales bacterium]
VLLVPALGGPERKLAEIYRAPTYSGPPAWSPDGKHLVVAARGVPQEPSALFLISVETGEMRKLLDPPPNSIGDAGAAFSPDGRNLAFSRSLSFSVTDLYLLPLTAGLQADRPPQRLTFDNRVSISPAWTPVGRSIVYVSDRTGSLALWRISPSSPGKPERIPSIGEDAASVAFSRRAPHRLAYEVSRTDRNIRRLTLPAASAEIFLSSTLFDSSPRYSPDARRIAFTSGRSGHLEIWTADADGSNAAALTSFDGPRTDLPNWSPDGRRLAFHSRPQGEARISPLTPTAASPGS